MRKLLKKILNVIYCLFQQPLTYFSSSSSCFSHQGPSETIGDSGVLPPLKFKKLIDTILVRGAVVPHLIQKCSTGPDGMYLFLEFMQAHIIKATN